MLKSSVSEFEAGLCSRCGGEKDAEGWCANYCTNDDVSVTKPTAQKLFGLLLILFVAFAAMGCAMHPLSDEERWQIREIHELGLEEKPVVSPLLAGVLNIVPGAGSAYLVINGEPWQAVPAAIGAWDLAGTLNWAAHEGPGVGQFVSLSMFWVWGIPSAIAEANAMNARATIRYYFHGPGKEELERRRRTRGPPR